MFHPTIYKIDSMGRTRCWSIESNETGYRTHSGLLDGKIVISGWQLPEEKNVGRSNATTVAEQVLSEVASKYERQLYQGKYAKTIQEAQKGAKFVECMLADKFDVKKTKDFPYWSQPKLDGVRALVSEDGIQSRNGKPLLSSPHILTALAEFFELFPDYILDGELYNHSLKDDFEKLISLARKTKPTAEDLQESAQMVQYHVYDVIAPEPMTYEQRKDFIEQNVAQLFSVVQTVPAVLIKSAEEADTKLGEYLEQGYEGQMLRQRGSLYEHKRAKCLIKHKTFEDEEFEIVDIIEGKGNWLGYAKSIEIRMEDGTTQQSGIRGTQELMKKLLAERETYLANGSQVTVRFQNRTSDNKLRFPVVIKLWKNGRNE
jgi:DNA ligase 1